MIKSVFLTNRQAPGDVCIITETVRDLKSTYPDLKINVATSAQYLWDNNPYLDESVTKTNAERVIKVGYPLINKSNSHAVHFSHGPRMCLEKELGVPINFGTCKVDIHLTEEEKSAPLPGLPERYWVINAGNKDDFTNKAWEYRRYQQVVDELQGKVNFVQVGQASKHHTHRPLNGAINMIGKTEGRDIIRLMYHSAGVLTGCSFMMHLSTMDTNPKQCRDMRPCVCLLGGREPVMWVQQRNMQCLHSCGLLDCCARGGCWKSRVEPLNDGDEKDKSLCKHPVKSKSGQVIPLCMALITVADVVKAVKKCEFGWFMGKK